MAEQIGVATSTKDGLLRKSVLYKSNTIGAEISAGAKREISFSGGLFMFKSSYHSTEETLYYATASKIKKISDTYDYTNGFAFDYKNGILSITNIGSVPKSVYAIMFELGTFRNS